MTFEPGSVHVLCVHPEKSICVALKNKVLRTRPHPGSSLARPIASPIMTDQSRASPIVNRFASPRVRHSAFPAFVCHGPSASIAFV